MDEDIYEAPGAECYEELDMECYDVGAGADEDYDRGFFKGAGNNFGKYICSEGICEHTVIHTVEHARHTVQHKYRF